MLLLILIIPTIPFPAYAAPPSIHILAAETLVPDNMTPAGAFFVGVASHALLDYTVQEQVFDFSSKDAWRKNAGVVFGEGVMLCLAYSKPMTKTQKWAVAGALLPDVIDGIYSLKNPKAWEAGLLIVPWHISF